MGSKLAGLPGISDQLNSWLQVLKWALLINPILARSQISSDNSWQREAVCLTQKRCMLSAPSRSGAIPESCLLCTHTPVFVLCEATSLPSWRLTQFWHQHRAWAAALACTGLKGTLWSQRGTQEPRRSYKYPALHQTHNLIQIWLAQTKSNRFELVQTSFNGSKLFWLAQNSFNPPTGWKDSKRVQTSSTSSNWIQLLPTPSKQTQPVLIWSGWFQTGPKELKLDLTCSDRFKMVGLTYSNHFQLVPTGFNQFKPCRTTWSCFELVQSSLNWQ